jgi:triosephosphate isomerase
MAQPLVIANWKMKLGVPESISLAKELKRQARKKAEVVVCPSFVSLMAVGKILKSKGVKLGGQDCFWEAEGAYTGEVSANQLREAGCEYVILGHSERRKNLRETDEMVHRKIKVALSAGLIPIICIGETFGQRQAGGKDYTLIKQITKALEGVEVDLDQQIVIAYEPVWVIGSGRPMDPDEAAVTHQIIKQTLLDLFSANLIKNNFRIIYGGSVNANNVARFIRSENTQGVLIGGASLDAEEFISIIKNTY